ncbi:hypothetical protein [Mycobacterium ulcerans]|uniref:hypothetical protein n=1 Tax=Mycobacterium ulcerans TaxID=1809 RepID=UPI00106CC2C4|nr:hypothetical protein [Mycobacterium ulcerans]
MGDWECRWWAVDVRAKLTQPGSRIAANGCIEYPLRRVYDVGHRRCCRVGGFAVSLSDNGVHRSNFCFCWPFAGQNSVSLIIARMSDVAQPITQVVDCIDYTAALDTLSIALVADNGETLFAPPVTVH